MKPIIRSLGQTAITLFILTAFLPGLNAQDQPPEFVREAVRSVERMLNSSGDAAIETFMERSMVPRDEADRNALTERLMKIRSESRGYLEDVSVEPAPDGVRMIISNGQEEKHLNIVLNFEAQAIADIVEVAPPERINITADNLSETIDQFEKEGMAGVIYVKINGEVVLKRAFGLANKVLGYSNKTNMVFGTGSRPIDYTVAAIYLLDQQGLVHLDDEISKYFDDVPEDKSTMTIRHLLAGQSGLPDFFHTEEDWDPDLAWIDRETAVKRLLSAKLLFEPGTGRSHSHAAFGLLAALIEIVTDQTYISFLNETFFVPAGMDRTGEYGDKKELAISDFAAGGGPQIIGLPNIPPNWGPTSWLVKGSGGMYSTLDDLLKFYRYVRSGKVLDEQHNKIFHQPSVNIDGSDRGFELFSAYMPPDNEVYLFLNETGNKDKMRQLFRALERLSVPQE
jgi:CubicO group peptidase (beta-lactamase class C family)